MSRDAVMALLARYGHDSVCSQALEPGLDYWFDRDNTACVAYRDTGSAWVSAGGPICALERHDEVIAAFARAAATSARRVRFFATEQESQHCKSILIGMQPEWQPAQWQATLAAKSSLREQLRRARAKGVTIRKLAAREIADDKGQCREQIASMVRDWQVNRPMAPMAFLVSLDLFNNAQIKHYFVAEQAGQVKALLVAAPIAARNGWFFENVLRAHDAVNGTVELLFDHAMRAALEDEIAVVSYGLAPLAGEVSNWLQKVRDHSRWLYDFEGLRTFKAKLGPQQWRPVYLGIPKHERGVRATIDALTAFADGSWTRFGLRTILHALPTIVWGLALLLLPWCLLLAKADAPRWFPNLEIKAAWLSFDMLLIALLVHLAVHWSPERARLLALLALVDAGLGLVQLVLHTGAHVHGFASWSIALIALAVPFFVSVLLALGAQRREALYLYAPVAQPLE